MSDTIDRAAGIILFALIAFLIGSMARPQKPVPCDHALAQKENR